MRPIRVQLRRIKGWRMPENTVSVARPRRWGNPWYAGAGRVRLTDGVHVNIGPVLTSAGVVDRFRRWHHGEFGQAIAPVDHPLYGLVMAPGKAPNPQTLRGKNLACWCKLCDAHKDGKPFGVQCADCSPCHADVLLELANAPARAQQQGERG